MGLFDESSLRKVKTISHLTLWFLLLASLFYFFSYPGVDNDLWGHLFFGREILRDGKLPLQNLYSYTAPGYPWINHEWLAEVIFYGIFYLFGSPGLVLLKLIFGVMIVWILDLIVKERARSPFVRVLTLVWAMAILSPGFNIRPQLFTYLFFAIFLFFFYRFEAGNKTALYWAPLLVLLWVNLHGGFVAGLGALGLFSLVTFFWADRQRVSSNLTRSRVLIPLVLSLLVIGLNPYGWDLLSFLWKDLLLSRPITEWSAVSLFDFSFLEFKLAFISVFLFTTWRGSYRRWDFALFFLAALFAIRHQRHTPLFAIVVAPLLAEVAQKISRWVRTEEREWLLTFGMLAMAIYLFQWIGRMHLEHRFQLVINSLEYPTQAANFLQRNGIEGNLAVPFDWGEYLIWKLYPAVRVSIDGRYTTAYPMKVVKDNFEWMGGGREWRRLLERYPTEIAITNRSHPVTALLRKDPEWIYIYSDPVAFVFVRKTPSQEGLLAKFKERRLLPPQTPPVYFPG